MSIPELFFAGLVKVQSVFPRVGSHVGLISVSPAGSSDNIPARLLGQNYTFEPRSGRPDNLSEDNVIRRGLLCQDRRRMYKYVLLDAHRSVGDTLRSRVLNPGC
jgi:hypothetical protein